MVFCEPVSSATSTMRHAVLAGSAPLARKIVDVAADLVEFLRAEDEVDAGQFLEDRRAAALRHAAEKADDLVLPPVLAAFQRPHLADGLLLGHVAHGAGVEQHHVGVVLVVDQLVAAPARSRATCSESRTFIWQP